MANESDRAVPVPISLPISYRDRLDDLAWSRRLNRSEMVRRLIDDATACPICGSPTRPDPNRPGCLWCDECQEPVIFTGEPAEEPEST